MKTISLCMIVKNEELSLEQCIKSIFDVVDEIIIVDTGSTDQTKEIAKKYTDKIYEFTWCDDFSAARNTAFSKATKDYILWMDADDLFLPEEKEKMRALKEELDDTIDGVMMKYRMGFITKEREPMTYYRQRLVRRACNQKWMEPVHEYLEIVGNVISKDIVVTHNKVHSSDGRNLRIYRNLLKEGKELSTRGLYYYAKELYESGNMEEAIPALEKYLDREEGWKEDKINACFILANCYCSRNERKKMQRVVLKSFEYGIPRAELCCKLGEYYIIQEDLTTAAYWYEIALALNEPVDCWGFIIHEYWNFVPLMQLCYCYDRLGQKEKACKCNERAASYQPDNPKVIYNRDYFAKILNKDQ